MIKLYGSSQLQRKSGDEGKSQIFTVHKKMTETLMDRASIKHTGAELVSVAPSSAGRETGREGERVRGVSERCWTDGCLCGRQGPVERSERICR